MCPTYRPILQAARLVLMLTGVAALGPAAALPVAAQDLTYTLNGVTFSDGAVATGYFDFNPTTNAYGSFDITTTNGVTDTQQGATFVSGIAFPQVLGFGNSSVHGTSFEFTAEGGRSNALILDTAGLPGTPGAFSLLPGSIIETSNLLYSGEFTYPPGVYTGSGRVITAGNLDIPGMNPVPEASTTISFGLLLALGLGGRVIAARKKKAFRATVGLSTLTLLSLLTLPANAQYQAINLSPPAPFFPQSEVSSAAAVEGGQQAGFSDNGGSHAALWSGSASSFVDLNPAGFRSSQVLSTAGRQQAGSGISSSGDNSPQALLWSGSAASAVNLNPAGFYTSQANGIGGRQEVGYGNGGSSTNYQNNAFLWTGTAASAVDLQPANLYGFLDSSATATDGVHQVGEGEFNTSDFQTAHALQWSGTASSAVDLNPSTAVFSVATALSGTHVAGQAAFGTVDAYSHPHAVLWNMAPSATGAFTFQDLQPAGYKDSFATGVSGTTVVGYGDTDGHSHALLWNGSATSFVDLNQFLPAGFTDAQALGLDANGDIVGYAYNNSEPYGMTHAFLWIPAVPEASTTVSFGLLLALGMGGMVIAAKRKQATS